MADKGKKVGRKKNVCAAYKQSQRREYNKARRMMKYLRRKPEDIQCLESFEKLSKTLYGNHRSSLGVAAFLEEFGG